MKLYLIILISFCGSPFFSQKKYSKDLFELKEEKSDFLILNQLIVRKTHKVKLIKRKISKIESKFYIRKQKTRCNVDRYNSKLSIENINKQKKQQVKFKAYKLNPSRISSASEFLSADNARANIVYANGKNNFNFNSSFCFAEDIEKNIWIGSLNEGLIKYDGHTYTLYSDLPNKLANNNINLFYDKKKKELYGFTDSGFFKIKNDSIYIPILKSSNSKLRIISHFQLKDKSILFGTYEGVLYRLKDNYIQQWSQKEGLPKLPILSISQGLKGELYLSFVGKGLYIFEKRKTKNLYLLNRKGQFRNIETIHFFNDKLYLGSFQEGLSVIDKRDTFELSIDDKFKGSIYSIVSKGNQLAYMNYGNYLVVIKDGKLKYFDQQQGLTAAYSRNIFIDSYDNIWVGNYTGIIQRIANQNISFEYNLPTGLDNLSVISTFYGAKTYFAFQRPFYIDKRTYFEENLMEDKELGSKPLFINDIVKLADSSIWISDYSHNPEKLTKNFVYQYELDGIDPFQTITNVCSDKYNRVWFLYYENGLAFENKGKFYRLTKDNGLYSNSIKFIHVNYLGELMLFYTDRCQVIQKNKIVTYSLDHSKLDFNNFNFFYADSSSKQSYFVSNQNQIFVYKNHKLKLLKDLQNFNGKIVSIQKRQEKLYVFTTKGLIILKINSKQNVFEMRYYGRNYNNFFHSANQRTILNEQGDVYWSNLNGLLKIDHHLLLEKNNKAYLKLSSINGKSLGQVDDFYTNDSLKFRLDFKFWGSEKDLILEAKLYQKGKIVNSFIINDLDLNLSNLPQGDYTLKFLLKNPLNQTLRETSFFSFKINPQWFETLFFKFLVIVFILLIFIGILKFQKWKNEFRKKELESIIQDKTKELLHEHEKLAKQNKIIYQQNEQKDALIQEIHHRVKNNLQIICVLIEMQLNSKNSIISLEETLRRIESMSIIHEMLYESENLNAITMDNYLAQLVNYCLELYKDLKKEIKVNSDIEQVNLDVSSSIAVGMLCSEFFSNTMKYANANPVEVNISLKQIEGKFIFEFKDNGKENVSNEKGNLGFKLTKIFSKQLKASVVLDKMNGYHYIITFE